jgi:hypothetical protein
MKPITAPSEETEASASTPPGVHALSFLAGLVVAFMGFKSAYQDFTHVAKVTHLENFTATPGKFLEVKVRRDSTGSEKDWYPDVLYEYFVDGKSIWGWRLSYEEEPGPKAYWEGRLAAYSKGAPVTVYYDAGNPKDSILEKKHESLFRSLMKMGLGLLFLTAGGVLAVLPAAAWIKGYFRK